MPTMSTEVEMIAPTSEVWTMFDWLLTNAMMVITSCTVLLDVGY